MPLRLAGRSQLAAGATIISIFLSVSSLTSSASTRDIARLTAILDNRLASLSVCIAYYTIIKECSPRGEDAGAARVIEDLSAQSRAAADALAMSSDEVALRLDINLSMQRQLIEGSCSQIPVLSSRYADQCAGLR
jgi:hypothetical protein